MRGQQPADPGGRRARLGEIDIQIDEDIEIIFVAAEGAGLDDVEVAGLPKGEDVFRRKHARFFSVVYALALICALTFTRRSLRSPTLGRFPERRLGQSFKRPVRQRSCWFLHHLFFARMKPPD